MRPPRRPPSVARRLADADRPPQAATGLGGIFQGLQKLMETLQGLSQKPAGEEGRVVFGYSIRTAGGETRAEAFGHVPPAAPPQASAAAPEAKPAAQQPIVDVFEEAEAIRVIAEMPGVGAADFAARVEDGALVLQAADGRWHKRVALPGAVDASGMTVAARHGIIEIRLPRAGGGA
ncbi:Hsp20/alpha crystallin family protein [Falsiroseomonas sp. E2-1-a20]|uniref:Hsp20/alpha crystallin family protein n=1 Tax=Falsiroseomonas sp. E2-1-a20 TaxID=3239300 RepID=UPI003F3E640A